MTFELDRWAILAILGILGMIFFATGEFLGWFNDVGQFGFWASMGLTVISVILTSSRGQVREVLRGLRRVEANTSRIEANTEAIPRIERNTAEALVVLRDIRDRLPPPPQR